MNVGEPPGALTHAPVSASTRSLSTARSVLRVLALLGEHPEGVRADEVAERLGKSTSTAYYLLSSLCEEGFAVHAPRASTGRPPRRGRASRPPAPRADPRRPEGDRRGALHPDPSALLPRRGAFRPDRDRRGPRPPGGSADARARRGDRDPQRRARAGHGQGGARRARADGSASLPGGRAERIHPAHDHLAQRLLAELELARHDGFAVDREEFDTSFCCLAAPIRDERGRFRAVLGLSVTSNVFDAERKQLADTVRGVATRASAARRAMHARRRSEPRVLERSREPDFQVHAENRRFLSQSAQNLRSSEESAGRKAHPSARRRTRDQTKE